MARVLKGSHILTVLPAHPAGKIAMRDVNKGKVAKLTVIRK